MDDLYSRIRTKQDQKKKEKMEKETGYDLLNESKSDCLENPEGHSDEEEELGNAKDGREYAPFEDLLAFIKNYHLEVQM